MDLKRVTYASVISIGLGLSTLTAGAGLATAQPGPPPCGPQGGSCQRPDGLLVLRNLDSAVTV